MDSPRKYPFNLPWPAVAIGTGFYAGLALFAARLARPFGGAIYLCLIVLGAIFAVLAFWMMTRRIIFPRVLELTSDAILYPKGFPTTRIVHIRYTDIIRMSEKEIEQHSRLYLTTSKGYFEIISLHLPDITTYLTVRDFICSKASITIARHEERRGGTLKRWGSGPEPILSWTEPTEWVQYRRALYNSKPLFLRIGRILRFFICCFGIIALPWLLLIILKVPTAPPAAYLGLAMAVTLFFTLLQWLSISHPVHSTKISFYETGVTQFFGKQTMDITYDRVSGWAIIVRQFQGSSIPILLLQINTKVRGCALPDSSIRDKLAAIFSAKNIPHLSDLKPSWE